MNKKFLKKILIGDLTFKRLIKSILFIYFFFFLFGLFFPDYLIFRPPHSSYNKLTNGVMLKTKDGHDLYGVYLENKSSQYTILYFHGNAEDLGQIMPLLDEYKNQGFSIFSYDYRGFGKSTGRPKEQKLYEDLDIIYNYLISDLNIEPKNIIIHGRSVGGGLATEIASRYNFGGLILESSFTSAFRVLTRIRIYPFDKYQNINKIKKIKSPVLFIHGLKDKVISSWHGKKLYKMANLPKYYYWVEDAGHNDLIWKDENKYWNTIINFAQDI